MKSWICDMSGKTFMCLEVHNVFPNTNDINVLLIIVTDHALQAHFSSWLNVFSGGISFCVGTTPFVICRHMFDTCSYRKNTVFDSTSDTDQLHCSKTCENLCTAIAVSRTDSITLVGRVHWVRKFQLTIATGSSQVSSNIIPLIYNHTLHS